MTRLFENIEDWVMAKAAETAATKLRREIEDRLVKQLSIPETLEGTKHIYADGFEIKVTGRINRRVDSDRLQELAAEAGLSDHLSSLFRWKPEVNLSVWKATDKAITTPLAAAITAEPGRPSFSITNKDA